MTEERVVNWPCAECGHPIPVPEGDRPTIVLCGDADECEKRLQERELDKREAATFRRSVP